MLNSSVDSHEPIFNNAVKAGAAADPNSKAEDSNGSNWSSKKLYKLLRRHNNFRQCNHMAIVHFQGPFSAQFDEEAVQLGLEASEKRSLSQRYPSSSGFP